jgi:hypothetical protein
MKIFSTQSNINNTLLYIDGSQNTVVGEYTVEDNIESTTFTLSSQYPALTATPYKLGTIVLSAGTYLLATNVYFMFNNVTSVQPAIYMGSNSSWTGGNEAGVKRSECPTYTNGGVQQITIDLTRVVTLTATTTYYIIGYVSFTGTAVGMNSSNSLISGATSVGEASYTKLI